MAAYTVMSTQVTGYVVLATDWNNIVNNFTQTAPGLVTTDGDIIVATGANANERLAAFDSSNLVKHEVGGLELDISGVIAEDGFYGSGIGSVARRALITQATAEAGTATIAEPWSATRVKQAIDALATSNTKTGTYTGDGTTSQGITGIGFAPKYVLIVRKVTSQTTVEYHYTTDVIVDDIAAGASVEDTGSATTVIDNAIISLDSDGFTVDDNGLDEDPNQNTVTFNYLAIR